MKEKNTGLIIAIVFLIILVTGAYGYIVYDKYLKPQDKQIIEPKIEKEEEIVTEDENEKMISIIKTIPYNIIKASDLSASQLVEIAWQVINEEAKEHTLKNINFITKSYFDITITENDLKTIVCSVDNKELYEYNSATDLVTIAKGHNHGGEPFNNKYISFVSSSKSDDKYVINVKTIYSNYREEGPATAFYKLDGEAKNNKNEMSIDLIKYENSDGLINTDKLLNDYLNKLYTFTFNFEKKEGNLVFKSYTYK